VNLAGKQPSWTTLSTEPPPPSWNQVNPGGPMTFASSGQDPPTDNTRATFGKHKGKTFQEIRDNDPGYCHWVRAQARTTKGMATCSPGLAHLAEYLRQGDKPTPLPKPPPKNQRASSSHNTAHQVNELPGDALNQLLAMIHQLDPSFLTGTSWSQSCAPESVLENLAASALDHLTTTQLQQLVAMLSPSGPAVPPAAASTSSSSTAPRPPPEAATTSAAAAAARPEEPTAPPAFPDNWVPEGAWLNPEMFDLAALEQNEEGMEETTLEESNATPEDPLQHLAPSLGALLQHPEATEETARLVQALLLHVHGPSGTGAEKKEDGQP